MPDAYDFSRAAWFMQIGASGRALDLRSCRTSGPTGWRGWMESVRQRLGDHIRKQLPGGEGEIAAALVNGDQDGIPKTDNDAMRRSGLAHLLSVSGLHLTAVVGAVMLLTLRLLALCPWLALRFRLTADRRRDGRARRHRLHDPHRQPGADDPLLHRLSARARRHRARPRGDDA